MIRNGVAMLPNLERFVKMGIRLLKTEHTKCRFGRCKNFTLALALLTDGNLSELASQKAQMATDQWRCVEMTNDDRKDAMDSIYGFQDSWEQHVVHSRHDAVLSSPQPLWHIYGGFHHVMCSTCGQVWNYKVE